ncbi:MAG: hypothetical protein R2772_02325 [Chitinophagales bacterium]
MSNKFTFGSNLKKWVYGLTIIGLLVGIAGALLFDETGHQRRLWANLLLNTYYFAGIAVTGVFFVAAHQLGYGGWHTVFKKIPIAMGRFLFVAFALILIIITGMWIAPESLYSHWAGHHTDSIVEGKRFLLTKFRYSVIVGGFYFLWALFAYLLGKKFISIKNWKEYSSAKSISAAFLLVFGVSSSVLSWLVIMSLDPHWYSTLFGWYNLASYFCGGFAMMILILIGLKKAGYLPNVHVDHIHDLGKLMFGFSIFWTYLMFSQFMLIWYANIPEATVWFNKRFDIPLFKTIFFLALAINFFLPLLVLMKRDSKRKFLTMAFASVMLIFGHYLDFFHMVMVEPMGIEHGSAEHEEEHGEEHAVLLEEGVLFAQNEEHNTVSEEVQSAEVLVEEVHAEEVHADVEVSHEATEEEMHVVVAGDAHGDEHHGEGEVLTHAKLGLVEIFMFFGFLGLFLLMTFTGLDGEELEIEEDPFLKESLHHHI